MVIILKGQASAEDVAAVQELVTDAGLRVDISQGVERTVVGVIGANDQLRLTLGERILALPCVETLFRVSKPYKRVSIETNQTGTTVTSNGVQIGRQSRKIAVMAGPCSVESLDQILTTARAVKAAGASLLRGGAFKPRTLPYDFQGLGELGLQYLAQAREETGLAIVTEVLEPGDVELVGQYTDIFQVGTRNMQNYALLRALGLARKPVLFKRGLAATLDEYLKAAEYILSGGNEDVILCERGIRSFDTEHYRNCFDLNAIPALKALTHLPVAADPSHATGVRELVPTMSRAAVAAGADALILEVHPDPTKALSDGRQSLTPEQFAGLMVDLARIAAAVDREI